jgi:hypothetical protein
MKFPKLTASKLMILLLTLAAVGLLYFVVQRATSPFQSELSEDVSRFSEDSIDVAMANGTIKHATPEMRNSPVASGPLLLFPPTEEDLKRLSG